MTWVTKSIADGKKLAVDEKSQATASFNKAQATHNKLNLVVQPLLVELAACFPHVAQRLETCWGPQEKDSAWRLVAMLKGRELGLPLVSIHYEPSPDRPGGCFLVQSAYLPPDKPGGKPVRTSGTGKEALQQVLAQVVTGLAREGVI